MARVETAKEVRRTAWEKQGRSAQLVRLGMWQRYQIKRVGCPSFSLPPMLCVTPHVLFRAGPLGSPLAHYHCRRQWVSKAAQGEFVHH